MALYEISALTIATGSGTAAIEIMPGVTFRIRIYEIGVSLVAATASIFGLGRPAAIGVTPTKILNLPEDSSDAAGVGAIAVAWGGTAPTVPAKFLRIMGLAGTIGNGLIWTFPKGLVISPNGSIVLWNQQTNSAANVYVVMEE